MTRRIFIIAGEASGDFLGGQLLQSLKQQNSNIEIAGIGGQHMHAQGLKSLLPMADLSLYGLFELLPHLFNIFKRIKQTKEAIKVFRPDVLVTIDSPGFCFRIAKYAKQLNIPVVHYVAPSVWAWKPGRAEKLAKKVTVDHLLCLLPFEPPYFTCHGLPSTFVGHPVTEVILPDDTHFRESLKISREATLICVLPGSRKSEIQKLLKIFLEAISKLPLNRRIEVVLPTLPHLVPLIEPLIKDCGVPVKIVTTVEEKWQAFMQSSIALAASGTVSLELAYAGVPQVIAYKVSRLTYWIAKCLVKTKYASLVNILNNAMVVPEYLQNQCNAAFLSKQLDAILADSKYQKQMRQKYKEAINALRVSDTCSSDVAASVVSKFLR
ncbi:MAG: lipid-A-disaccharide synthase [Alphaproteobacteria bacterium]